MMKFLFLIPLLFSVSTSYACSLTSKAKAQVSIDLALQQIEESEVISSVYYDANSSKVVIQQTAGGTCGMLWSFEIQDSTGMCDFVAVKEPAIRFCNEF